MGPDDPFPRSGTTTGRSLVLFEAGAAAAGREAVQVTGGRYFEALGVAVLDGPPDQIARAGVSTTAAGIAIVEPERTVHALELGEPPVAVDESRATWGLQATNVVASARTGRGIRVAVLDTGFDAQHPDFSGRAVTAESFVDGETAQDGHGHGTHCIGTALGPASPATGPRYGIAFAGEIFAGKVLSDAGSGADAGILAGIEWALQHGCAVISMSLGSPTEVGQPFSQVFERVARRVQDQGGLIVAAAGNDSDRPGTIKPVGHPADCPSIMAVAALDVNGAVAPFSNGGLNPDGGRVDIAGPGVDVLSSWPMPIRYRRISGTSMATPHVAGIAALYAEADPAARGAALGTRLTAAAQRGTLAATDVGAGLVQAP